MDLATLRAQQRAARNAAPRPRPATDATTTARHDTGDLACRHRGAVIERTGCGTCGGGVQLKVFACDHPEVAAGACVLPHGKRAGRYAECASCLYRSSLHRPQRLPWAVGVTASKRPAGDTLGHTLATLAAAGWSDPIVFADGDGFDAPAGVRVVRRHDQAGALCNFFAAAAELLVRYPDAVHLIAQDDTTWSVGVREYLERTGWPADAVLLKLFTSREVGGGPAGWSAIPPAWEMRGAQAYVFPPGQLAELVASEETLRQRAAAERSNEAIDNVVARWARGCDGRQYVHTPSPCDHTGRSNSTLGHDMPPSGCYRGDAFDFRVLCPRPTVTAVMVTQGGREVLAQRAADAFMRQSYPADRRELLVVTDGPDPLAEWEPPTGSDTSTIRVEQVTVPTGERRPSLGELRNYALEQVRTELVVQWDDDDYSTADRLAYQVEAWQPGRAVVLRRQLRADLYAPGELVVDWARGIEGTILHAASEPHRYPDTDRGEDTAFAAAFGGALEVVDNPPELYVRLYHGRNTWDRRHILGTAGSRPSGRELAVIDNVRRLYPQTARTRHRFRLPEVEGWATSTVCFGLIELLELQRRYVLPLGRGGSVLEIGVHHGRTLLGLAVSALEAGDRVVAVDPFGTGAAGQAWHDSPRDPAMVDGARRRQLLEEHLQAVFGCRLPQGLRLIEKRSQDVPRAEYLEGAFAGRARPYRLVHVDGSHEYDDVLADLRLAVELLDPAGLLVIDDVLAPRWLGVAAATWQHLEPLGLLPVALLDTRLVCALEGQAAAVYRDHLAPRATKQIDLPTGPVLWIPHDEATP